MIDSPWPPDWRKKEDYPDPTTTSPRIWAWEYLRRNPRYQQLCDKMGLDWFKQYRKTIQEKAALTDADIASIINPSKKEVAKFYQSALTKLVQFCPTVELSRNQQYDYDSLCYEFNIIHPDHFTKNHPIVFFETDVGCIRPTKPLEKYATTLKPFSSQKVQAVRRSIWVKKVENGISSFTEICDGIEFARDPGGEKHLNYLRVFDANKKGANDHEIAEIILGSLKRISNIDKALATANDYIHGKFIVLPAPTLK